MLGRVGARVDAALRERCLHVRRSQRTVVAMVEAGLGVSVVLEPRRALVDAHRVRMVDLGRRCPTRQIAAVRWRADADKRNVDAVVEALAFAYLRARL